MRKIKNCTAVILLLMVALLAVGCFKKDKNVIGDISVNTLTVNEDGTLREIACENFEATGVTTDGLEKKIESEIKDFCASNGKDSVKLLQYKDDNSFVKVAIDYSSMDVYNNFNGTRYGDVAFTDIPLDEAFKDVSGNDVQLADIDSTYKVFVIDGNYNLTINGEILYYNTHVSSLNGTKTAVTDGTGEAIIIYK